MPSAGKGPQPSVSAPESGTWISAATASAASGSVPSRPTKWVSAIETAVWNAARARPGADSRAIDRKIGAGAPTCTSGYGRAWLRLASLAEECGDVSGRLLEFRDLAISGDEVLEHGAAFVPFQLETLTLTLGRLTRFLCGEQAGTRVCLCLLLTLALLTGLARGFLLQPAALGGEPLHLGIPRRQGSRCQGSLGGALTLGAPARSALLGFLLPPGPPLLGLLPRPGLPLLLLELRPALGGSNLTAHQVAATGGHRAAAVLLAHLAAGVHLRHVAFLHHRVGRGPGVALGDVVGIESADAAREEEEDEHCETGFFHGLSLQVR